MTIAILSPDPAIFKMQYLLEDRFEDTLAAGAVNGTLSTGGQLRTVTDTGSKISVGAGLNFATGETANDAVWYPSVARTAGQILLARLVASEATNGIPVFGWDSAASGAILDHLKFGASGVLQVVANGGTAFTVGAYTATTYDIAAVMRATGIQWFIKGGAFTTWRFLWSSLAGTAAGFPAIASGNTTAVFTAQFIVSPSGVTWLAAPTLSDSFNRANGVLGTTDGAGHAETSGVGAGGSGLAWVFDAGVWTVATNAAVGTPTPGSDPLTDGALDNWTSPTNLTSWTETVAGTSTINQESVVVHTALGNACRMDIDASNSNAYLRQNSKLTVGTWYQFVLWGQANADGKGVSSDSFEISEMTLANGTWTQFIRTARALTTFMDIKRSGGASASLYVDDVTIVPLTLSSLFATVNLGTANVLAHCEVKTLTAGTQCGMVLRLDSAASPANFILVDFDGAGNIKIVECVAGVYTQLASVASAFTTADTLVVSLSGSAYRCYKVATSGTGTATLISAGTTNVTTGNLHGTFSTYSGNAIERIAVWPKGTGGEYEFLSTLTGV